MLVVACAQARLRLCDPMSRQFFRFITHLSTTLVASPPWNWIRSLLWFCSWHLICQATGFNWTQFAWGMASLKPSSCFDLLMISHPPSYFNLLYFSHLAQGISFVKSVRLITSFSFVSGICLLHYINRSCYLILEKSTIIVKSDKILQLDP